jgi:hypothetical protein
MPITYIEKGIGLHESIAASGNWVAQIDGVWRSSDDVAVQPIIDNYTLDQAKIEKCAQVLAHAAALRDKVTAAVAAGEMASWPIKRAEAEDYYRIGEAAACPALRAEAQARGIPLAQLVVKVNANAARFMAAEAMIGGTDGRHRDAINALATFDAVAAYDYSTGWPEV